MSFDMKGIEMLQAAEKQKQIIQVGITFSKMCTYLSNATLADSLFTPK